MDKMFSFRHYHCKLNQTDLDTGSSTVLKKKKKEVRIHMKTLVNIIQLMIFMVTFGT